MLRILTIVQILVSVLLIAAILLQQRGGGLSPVLGGGGAFYRSRRGMERTLFRGTIALAALFLLTALLNLILR